MRKALIALALVALCALAHRATKAVSWLKLKPLKSK